MRRILVKRKSDPGGVPLIAYRQDDGSYIIGDDMGKPVPSDELLLPVMNDGRRDEYETAILQGILSNPTMVTGRAELLDEDVMNDILTFVDKMSALCYYDDCDTFE